MFLKRVCLELERRLEELNSDWWQVDERAILEERVDQLSRTIDGLVLQLVDRRMRIERLRRHRSEDTLIDLSHHELAYQRDLEAIQAARHELTRLRCELATERGPLPNPHRA